MARTGGAARAAPFVVSGTRPQRVGTIRWRHRDSPSPLCGLADPRIGVGSAGTGKTTGPLSRAGEGQGEGGAFSGKSWSLTPTLSRTGEGACRAPSRAAVSDADA
ncbi:hypothetical protein FV233_19500 [Methylobacterium sp. WL7]|nr:hypothetical protein FV233_19500 [Methylobacterium sp. WL7]